MISYQRIAVALNFSPTLGAVAAEAKWFAQSHDAAIEVIHAAERTDEKEKAFRDAMGEDVVIHWVVADSPAAGIAQAVKEHGYELLIAGALQKEDADKPFTSGVARDLLRQVGCDLLLLPGPNVEGHGWDHVVFACEPGENCGEFLRKVHAGLGFTKATITAPETPFAAAMAASRGEAPRDTQAWMDDLVQALSACGVETESWIVRSNTGYSLCDTIEGLKADLLIVRGQPGEVENPLPMHLNWLYQVIPVRLLVVRSVECGCGSK